MANLNKFAARFQLREMINWSKVWEYPWLWFNGLSSIAWKDKKVCDLGSELSPIPWFLASMGADVTIIETDTQYIPTWDKIKQQTQWNVRWQIVDSEHLPFPDRSINVVTSFSVIEHQPNKENAIREVARVLKPGSIFAISFDICEPDMGMTFPAWNGSALTMNEFEKYVWNNPEFAHESGKPQWNLNDIQEFIRWHLQSAQHHNYTVGAAILQRM